MPKIITDIEQGADEWHQLRLGSIGGTAIDKIMPKGKGRKTLLYQLSGEIITQEPYFIKQTPAMKRGLELEEEARKAFGFITGYEVTQVALITGEEKYTHISPDGILDGCVPLEIKCFETPNHMRYLDKDKIIDIKYHRQTQWALNIAEQERGWFFAYHPKMKPLIIRTERDEPLIKEMNQESKRFVEEMLELVERIK